VVGSAGGSFEVFKIRVVLLDNLPEVGVFLRLNILLNQLVEVVGIAMFDDADDLIPRGLIVARGKELQ
jgi:hypothetical protein